MLSLYVDWLTKYTKLIPCLIEEELLTAGQVAMLFFQHVVQYYGILTSIIYDRNPIYTSDFWQSLWKLLGLHAIEISTHYPQADGLKKRMNCTIGQIFYTYLPDKDQEH